MSRARGLRALPSRRAQERGRAPDPAGRERLGLAHGVAWRAIIAFPAPGCVERPAPAAHGLARDSRFRAGCETRPALESAGQDPICHVADIPGERRCVSTN